MSTTPTHPDTPASTSTPSAITDAATSIRPGKALVTLINVFTVAPEHQQELIEVLDRATVQVIRHVPGFVSANIHRGLDGTRVANYAQWTSRAAYEAMLGNPAAGEHMAAAAQLATFEPTLYEVASVHPAPPAAGSAP
jgi:quinol monooxygenase YgiN